MNKNTCVIACPIDCYSGYSSRSRDFVKSLIQLKQKEWDISIIPLRWGSTPWGFIKDHHKDWGFLEKYLIPQQLSFQPDIWIQISVTNEFQKVGKYNIGVSAGIETTLCAPGWIKGINNMDLILVSSEHAKTTFMNSKYEMKDEKTGQPQGILKVEKPIEVIFEGVLTDKYYPIKWA